MQNWSSQTPIVSRTHDKHSAVSSPPHSPYTFPRLTKKYILTRELNVRVRTTRNDVAPVYLLPDGSLVCRKLLARDDWIQDHERKHCTVCMQHFLPFRRRHHCRTCGEVVCNACSYHRRIHITDLNVGFVTRLCTFCIIHAGNASVRVSKPNSHSDENQVDEQTIVRSPIQRLSSKRTESVMTDGSVVQLWPLPGHQSLATFQPEKSIPLDQNETRSRAQSAVELRVTKFNQKNLFSRVQPKLPVTSNLTNPISQSQRLAMIHTKMLLNPNHDPTMETLLSIVAKTLACPAALIGSVDEKYLWIHASIGMESISKMPREDFVCIHQLRKSETVWIVQDATWDKHFHAATIMIKGAPIRFYAGATLAVKAQRIGVVSVMDDEPHKDISNTMKSTLEAVGKIASEVLEQRLQSASSENGGSSTRNSIDDFDSLFDENLEHAVASSFGCNDSKAGPGRPSCMTMFFNLTSEMQDAIHECMRFMNESLRPQPDLVWKQRRDAEDGICASFEGIIRTDSHTQIKLYRNSFRVLVGPETFTLLEMIQKCMDPRVTLSSDDWFRQFFRAEGYIDATLQNRHYFSPHTWMDHFLLKQDVSSEEEKCCILTYKREYPDGSAMIVTLVYDEDAMESPILTFLFGWLITSQQKKNINVTCLVAQQCSQNETHDKRSVNVSAAWCLHLLQMYKSCTHVSMPNKSLQLSKLTRESRLATERVSESSRESDIEEVVFTRSRQRERNAGENKRQLLRCLIDQSIFTQQMLKEQRRLIEYASSRGSVKDFGKTHNSNDQFKEFRADAIDFHTDSVRCNNQS